VARDDASGRRSRNPAFARANSGKYLAHLAAWGYVALLVLPLYYLLISSVKDNVAIFNDPFLLTGELRFDNFTKAIEQAALPQAIVNSVYVTVAAEALTLAVALPAAYAIARARGRLRQLAESVFGLGFLIPGFAALVPSVMLAITLGLFQTREFLILLLGASAIPLSVLLLAQAIRSVPTELEESAVIDGAGPARVFWSIVLPLTIPSVVVVAILNFLSFWNEYFFALVIGGTGVGVRTVQVALPTLSATTNAQFGVLAAGVVVSLVPVYVVYGFLARKMEGAVLAGALKG